MIAAILSLASAPCAAQVTLRQGLAIPLLTVDAVSSKTAHKGDIVALLTAADVVVDGKLAIARGTAARGQIADARATGGLGVNGRLEIRPLYLSLGDATVRLIGSTTEKRGTPAGTVIGIAALSPLFSGRGATIAARTAIPAIVEKSVVIEACQRAN